MDNLNTMDKQVVVPKSLIKSELTNLFQSEFVKVVSDTIDTELQKYQSHLLDEAKDKFYNELSSSKEKDYPELIDYKGSFKFCGKCNVCDEHQKGHCERRKEIISRLSCTSFDFLLPNEYVLGCCLGGQIIGCVGNQNRCHSDPAYMYITTHGRLLECGSWGVGRSMQVQPPWDHPDIPNNKLCHLSQEYLTIISTLDVFRCSGDNRIDFIGKDKINEVVSLYHQYHPKATEICKIEMKQKEIQKSIIQLQSLETEQATQKGELDKRYKSIKEQEDRLIKNQQVHKDKLKNLFQREKSVQMKETLYGCKEELKDIALQLNDMYVLTDSPDESIQSKLNDILGTLNTLYATSVNEHVMATAV